MTRLSLLLGGLVVTAALPLAAQSGAPRFEVVSVKPNTGSDLSIPFGPTPPEGITMINRPLESIVRYAYNVDDKRMSGLPAWAFDERFDVNAKASRPISNDERRQMVQTLLVERFQLKARREPREQQVYVVTRLRPDGSVGPGLRPRPDCGTGPVECERGGSAFPNGGKAAIRGGHEDLLTCSSSNPSSDQRRTDMEIAFPLQRRKHPQGRLRSYVLTRSRAEG